MAKTIVNTQTETEIDPVIAKLNFDGADMAQRREQLEALQSQVQELETALTADETASEVRIDEAIKMVKALRKAKLSDELIENTIKSHFQLDVVQKPRRKRNRKRINRKLDGETIAKVVDFIAKSKDGASMKDIWTQFADLDKLGLQMAVRKIVTAGQLETRGKTRQLRYYASAA